MCMEKMHAAQQYYLNKNDGNMWVMCVIIFGFQHQYYCFPLSKVCISDTVLH